MNDAVILSPGAHWGEVTVPSSKSHVHRLLIAAAVGQGVIGIRLRGFSKDILATADCLQAMGADIRRKEDSMQVKPLNRVRLPEGEATLPCGESGSTLRFLLPVLGALGMEGCFRMEGRLPQRPMELFEDELRGHGMRITREGSLLHAAGPLQPGKYRLPGNVSSQYFSGLLFALPLLEGDSMLTVEGEPESAAYIRMTEAVLEDAGIAFERKSQGWVIPGGQKLMLPPGVTAEGDWSNAAFFLCLGALSEGGVTVRGLRADSVQGDRAVLDTLKAFGAEMKWNGDAVTVRAGERRAFTLDASGVPDLVPVLSVLACAAEGESVIENAARLRMKESDRLRSTAQLITDLGGRVCEKEDGLVIRGTGSLRGGKADSAHDHRIAMSAAVAAAICREPVEVSDPACVEKSYPEFWKDLERLRLKGR
jgi:3-phosphoshikimate 1-carboxyvinyltransferase